MLLEMGNQDGIHHNNNNIINIDKEKNNTRRGLAKKQETCFAEKKTEARWCEICQTKFKELVSVHIMSASTYRHSRKS
jgi:hypothetical protein